MTTMTLTTDRLLLRPIVTEDADDIYEYSRNDNVGPNAGWKPHESIEETRLIMEQVFMNQEAVFGVVLKESGKLIGTIGLVKDPKRENDKARMLGYAIGESSWGQGLMTEAVRELLRYGFEELHLDLISAYCYPHNQRSKRVLEKCGFLYEGTLRQCEQLFDGNTYDNECYALLVRQN